LRKGKWDLIEFGLLNVAMVFCVYYACIRVEEVGVILNNYVQSVWRYNGIVFISFTEFVYL